MEKIWNLPKITKKDCVGGVYRICFLKFVFSVHALLCCTFLLKNMYVKRVFFPSLPSPPSLPMFLSICEISSSTF